jgi:Holliday junction resolvase-like predicted endonuclease
MEWSVSVVAGGTRTARTVSVRIKSPDGRLKAMRNVKKIKLTKIERMFQKINNWTREFADTKLFFAVMIFMVALYIWILR